MTDGQALLCDYYSEWIETYKRDSVSRATIRKYEMALKHLQLFVPNLRLSELNRTEYQKIINAYAETHEKQTVTDFHHLIKAAILDAVDDGYIATNPTRRVAIKGKPPTEKKQKYLDEYEMRRLIGELKLGAELSNDYFIYLVAKTGLRFSEALAVTPTDFDFEKAVLDINKSWDYKNGGFFKELKTKGSKRRIQLDWKTSNMFAALIKDMPVDKPIFLSYQKIMYSTTVNDQLARHCRHAGVPVVSVHGLRHSHASILFYAGASIASVSRRLGHADITVTQKVYLHIIRELESMDIDIIMRSMSIF